MCQWKYLFQYVVTQTCMGLCHSDYFKQHPELTYFILAKVIMNSLKVEHKYYTCLM